MIFNWNYISWIFSYRTVSQLFLNFSQKIISVFQVKELKQTKILQVSKKENEIEIPKLKISAPIVLVEEHNQAHKALDRGVVLYPGSVLPGQVGQTIILGHSAPPQWPRIKYDWVFSRLNELKQEDEIIIFFEQKKYIYKVKEKIFLQKGEEIPKNLTNSKNMLILITCWPPGKNIKRIAVVAE